MTTASVKERKEIFGDLKQCLKGKGTLWCVMNSYSAIIMGKIHLYLLLPFLEHIFRVTRACSKRTMQATLSDNTQISVGFYTKQSCSINVLEENDNFYIMEFMFLRDSASRRELLSVIGQLAENQPDILVTSLLHCLLNSGVISKSGEPR